VTHRRSAAPPHPHVEGEAAPSPAAARSSASRSITRDKLALGAILALAAIVHFYRLDLTWFFLDHVRDVSVAANIATGASFPLLGPRIGWTEAYLGPLYFYMLAIPFSISRDPVAGIVLVAGFHVAALLALYRFAREFFGPGVALYASAFFAVFPLTAFSARLVVDDFHSLGVGGVTDKTISIQHYPLTAIFLAVR